MSPTALNDKYAGNYPGLFTDTPKTICFNLKTLKLKILEIARLKERPAPLNKSLLVCIYRLYVITELVLQRNSFILQT